MLLVETHRLDKRDEAWSYIDALSSKSKTLYNRSLYVINLHHVEAATYRTLGGPVFSLGSLYKRLKDDPSFRCRENTKIMKQVFRQLQREFSAHLAALKEYNRSPAKFNGCPKPPRYKDPKSRNSVTIPFEALSFTKTGYIRIAKTGLEIKSTRSKSSVKEVRIIPKKDYYKIEVVYERKEVKVPNKGLYCGIDLGINNLMAITANDPAVRPLLVNGRPLKSINQYYNKKASDLNRNTNRYQVLLNKRNNKINDYLHKASRLVVDWLVNTGVKTVIIGRNKNWKNKVNMGKRNNQNFSLIPHHRLIQMLTYKCQLLGIEVVETEESYTSKCSFLDMEKIAKRSVYAGERVNRGLFVSRNGTKINADINASLNIMRKVAGNGIFVPDSVEVVETVRFDRYAVRPLSLTPSR